MNRMFGWYRPESDRYYHLDVLRFFASFAIVVFHYRGLLANPLPPSVSLATDPLRLAVDLFFVISGVMMGDLYWGKLSSRVAYGTFLRKRFARLAPLHYATLAMFIVLAAASTAVHLPLNSPEVFSPACILPNVLMVQAFNTCDHLSFNGPSWSISAEMALYLALPLLFVVAARRRLTALLVAVAVVALFAYSAATGGNWTFWTFDFGVVRAVPSFVLGLGLARSGDGLTRLPRPRALLCLAILAFAASCVLPVGDAPRLILVYLIVISALAADRQGVSTRLVRGASPLGRLTYSLYMLHMPASFVLVSGIGKHVLHLSGTSLNVLLIATAVIVLPVASVLSYTLFETPMRRLLSGPAKARSADAELRGEVAP